MSRISTPAGLAFIVVCLVLVAIGAVLLAQPEESAGPEEQITLQQVAENPARYDGEVVAMSGEIQESDYFSLADAEIVFAIGDDAGGQVLVYPQEGVDLPPLTSDAVVQVEGTVRRVEPNEETDHGVLNQGGLLSETGAEAVVEATEVTIPAGDLDEVPNDPPVRRATISQILADPEAFDGLEVQVPGIADQVGSAGFVLRSNEDSIFVSAPRSDLSGLETGDRVRISADVWLLSQWRADTIPQALDPTPLTDLVGEDKVQARDIPDQAGDAFLALRRFTQGGPESPTQG